MADYNPAEEFERRFPDVHAAFRKVDEDLRRAMFMSPTEATEQREQIYYSVRALAEVRTKMIAELTAKHLQKITDEHAATLAKSGAATA
jgi:hypothetical protein